MVIQQEEKKAAMDKLKETILKLCNTQPSGPLTPTQHSILQQRLSHFISSGLHTTPDHPPYAWMIQRALQELHERWGSTEDSISEFIKKEYENLPWAHMTLLKHHLHKLSENGEILVARGGRFRLAGARESLNSKRKGKRKYKRKYKKRKTSWGLEVKRKKKRGRKKKKHDDTDEMELDDQQNEVATDNEDHGQHNGIREELNGHHNELIIDKKVVGQSDDVTENEVLPKRIKRIRIIHKQKEEQQQSVDTTEGPLVACESDVGGVSAGLVPIEQPPSFMMTEEAIEHLEDSGLQPQELSLCGHVLENEQPGDNNLAQISSPTAPPGFEFIPLEDCSANKAHNPSASVGLEDDTVHQNSEGPAEDQSPRMEDGLSDALEQQSEEILKRQETQQHQGGSSHSNDGSTPSAPTVLSLNQNQQQSLDTERLENEFVDEDLLKIKKQQKKKPGRQALNKVKRRGTVTPKAPLVLALQSQQQKQHISGTQLPVQRKRTRTQLKGIITQPASSTHVEEDNFCESKQQVGLQGDLEKTDAQQLTELSNMEGIELAIVEPSSEEQQLLQEERSIQEKLIITQPASSTHAEEDNFCESKQQVDLQGDLEKTDAQQLTEGSRGIELAMVEPSSEKQQLLQEERSTQEKLSGIITQPELSTQVEEDNFSESKQQVGLQGELEKTDAQQLTEMSDKEGSGIELAIAEPSSEKKQLQQEGRSTPEKLNEDDDPVILLLKKPRGSEAVTVDKSSHRDRAQRQLRRWSRSPREPEPVRTSKTEPLPLKTEEPLALETNEEADHQHEVHSEQRTYQRRGRVRKHEEQHEVHLERPTCQRRGRQRKSEEDTAKQDSGTISPLATNEDESALIDHQPEVVQSDQQKSKPVRRTPKHKEEGGRPVTRSLGMYGRRLRKAH